MGRWCYQAPPPTSTRASVPPVSKARFDYTHINLLCGEKSPQCQTNAYDDTILGHYTTRPCHPGQGRPPGHGWGPMAQTSAGTLRQGDPPATQPQPLGPPRH